MGANPEEYARPEHNCKDPRRPTFILINIHLVNLLKPLKYTNFVNNMQKVIKFDDLPGSGGGNGTGG